MFKTHHTHITATLAILALTTACSDEPISSESPAMDMSTEVADMRALPDDMNTSPDPVDMQDPTDMDTTPNPTDMSTEDMNTRPPIPGIVDPQCIDGQYNEQLPELVDISAQMNSYSPSNVRAFYESVLELRYPMGAKLVKEAPTTQIDCVAAFTSNPFTAQEAFTDLNTIVHECGHVYDLGNSGFFDNHYAINMGLSFTCSDGDSTDRGGKTFARNRIAYDAFSVQRPYCDGFGPDCDFYADTYLDGNPDDGDISASGDQGYGSLLEESVQYVNSLATGYAFHDQYTNFQSDRDGILTFLWYIGRYLHMARTQYPEVYNFLVQDDCWRQATLTVWGRGWLYLEATKGYDQLGISDDAIEPLVKDPTILNEIELLRQAEGCN